MTTGSAPAQLPARGLLFDLDGTLIDSGAVVRRSWQLWAERTGTDPADFLHLVHGRPADETMALILPGRPAAENDADHAWMVDYELTHTEGIVPLPGAAELFAALHALPGRPFGIVTACPAPLAAARLEATGLTPPPVLVTADQLAAGKPDPEGYLTGAARLGLPPESCVVFEDAPAGVTAARAAGMACVGIGAHSAEGADAPTLRVDTPEQITVAAAGDGSLRVLVSDAESAVREGFAQ